MSWNPVLDLFIEVKETYIELYGANTLWNYQDNNIFSNCLSYWIWHIANNGHPKQYYYQDIIRPLILNEYNGMLLIRYKDLGIDWDAYDGFYKECRSVVINIYDDELILTPFRKFRNVNECEENSLENIQRLIQSSHNVEVTDKLDGSMASARYYNNHIIISGSQALDRERSFRVNNYYNWLWKHDNIYQMLKDLPDYTFIFEGIFFNDIHVVKYDSSMEGLHLVGMRNVYDGIELSYTKIAEIAEKYDVPHVQVFNMTFEEAYQDAINNGRAADEGEGYVIDIDSYKIKVKYDDYVKIHHAIGKMLSPNAIIDSIKDDTWDDFYSKIPLAYREQAKEIYDNVCLYVKYRTEKTQKWYNKVIQQVGINSSRKDFMIAVDDIVPKTYQGNVRAKFLNQDIDFLNNVKYPYILNYIQCLT